MMPDPRASDEANPPTGSADLNRLHGIRGMTPSSLMQLAACNGKQPVEEAVVFGRSFSNASWLMEYGVKGVLDPSFLVTHRFPREEAPRGDELFNTTDESCVRAVLVP